MSYAALLNQQVLVFLNPKRKFLGDILKVGEDFLLLEEEMLGLLIIPLEHVKQIRISNLQSDLVPHPPKKFKSKRNHLTSIPERLIEVLKGLCQTVVQLEGGGVEPTVGYLIDAQQDFLAVCTIPEGIVYFPIRHVLTVLLHEVSIQPEFSKWVEQHQAELVQASSFHDLLKSEIGNLIKLGRGSPEDLSGILKEANDECIEVVTGPCETVWVPMHHVKTVTRHVRFEWLPQ